MRTWRLLSVLVPSAWCALHPGLALGQAQPTYEHALPWEVSTWYPAWGHATPAELRVVRLAPTTDTGSVGLDRVTLLGRHALVVRASTSSDRNRWRDELFVYLLGSARPRLAWRGVIREATYDVPPAEAHGLSGCLYVVSDSTLEYQLFLAAGPLAWPRFAPVLAHSGRYTWSPSAQRFVRTGPVSAALEQACEESGERDPD